MFAAAAEETRNDLYGGRGDAYCGMLSASYNVGLRNLKVHIPVLPRGDAARGGRNDRGFHAGRADLLGLRDLKIFSFGPRPYDFLTCHAPIKPLFDLGVEIMENSELDMYDLFLEAKGDPSIPALAREMAGTWRKGTPIPNLLEKLAQFEIALLDYHGEEPRSVQVRVVRQQVLAVVREVLRVRSLLHQRPTGRARDPDLMRVGYLRRTERIHCDVCYRASPAILDINNTVPHDMFAAAASEVGAYANSDLFMGFHCGNTSSACMVDPSMKYQLIMHRLMEPGKEPNITRGTLEGQIRPAK